MSETPRSSYLEHGEDQKNLLSKSWDAESRFRLQENALSLPTGEDDTALFRVKVELGLHELTAALTSLSRRIDKLEETTAPPDAEKQHEAVKELARSARCLSQALPGIASARTRRRALHGYFRESDEQRGGYGDRIDPAARALVIEGLVCLSGKVRVETARGSKANDGGVWSSKTRATREFSPSPRRRKPSAHSSVGETGVASEEEKMFHGVISRDDGDGDTSMLAPASERDFSSLRNLALRTGFTQEGECAPGRLEVEHLRGRIGPSLPPSPISLTGSTNDRMFQPGPAPKKTKDRSLRAESKVGWRAESTRLTEPNDGKPRNKPNTSAGSNGGGGGGGSGSNSLSSSSAVQDDSSSRATKRASTNYSALGATGGSRVEKGRASEDARSESPNDANVPRVGASERTVGNCDNRSNTTQLMNTTSAAAGGTRGTPGEAGSASDRDALVRMLLNAAGGAAEAEERAGGPGAQGNGQGFARRALRSLFGSDGGGSRGGGIVQVGQEDPEDFRQEVDVVSALSSHVRGSASSTSSSSASASCGSHPAAGSARVFTAAVPAGVVQQAKASEVPVDKSGGKVSPEGVSLDALENVRSRSQRSLLDVVRGKNTPLVDDGRRSSFSCQNEVSLERDSRARLVDAQGFLDLGAASTCGVDSAGLGELKGQQSEGPDPEAPDPEISDPGVAELEAKLEELRKIGDRIKDEAAATMEPSVTIPSQDFSESGSPFPPSRHPHHLEQTSRSGRTRGTKAVGAAAGSAFTSAESSPCRSAVDLLSCAVPPPRPDDHQGTEPALSNLLAPPFNNAALRGEFIASLEQHLAQYEDGTRHTIEDAPGKAVGDGNVKVDDMVAACDGDGDQDCGSGSRDKRDGTSTSVLGTVTTVREIPASSVAAEAGSKRMVRAPPKEVGETENVTPNATGATSGVSREDTDGVMEGEERHDKTPMEETPAGKDAKTSVDWAQEYHDYLCSKDP